MSEPVTTWPAILWERSVDFRPDRRRSSEPDATEGREVAQATAERDARISLALARVRLKSATALASQDDQFSLSREIAVLIKGGK